MNVCGADTHSLKKKRILRYEKLLYEMPVSFVGEGWGRRGSMFLPFAPSSTNSPVLGGLYLHRGRILVSKYFEYISEFPRLDIRRGLSRDGLGSLTGLVTAHEF